MLWVLHNVVISQFQASPKNQKFLISDGFAALFGIVPRWWGSIYVPSSKILAVTAMFLKCSVLTQPWPTVGISRVRTTPAGGKSGRGYEPMERCVSPRVWPSEGSQGWSEWFRC